MLLTKRGNSKIGLQERELCKSSRSKRRFLVTTLSLLTALIPVPLLAQDRVQDQIDFQRSQSDALQNSSQTISAAPTRLGVHAFTALERAAAQGQPPCSLTLTGPFRYSDKNSLTRGIVSGLETIPEGKVACAVQPDGFPIKFSGYFDLSIDRYIPLVGSPTPLDFISGLLRADIVGLDSRPNLQRWVPYVSYAPQGAFTPFYSVGSTFNHDLALGVAKAWAFNDDFTRVEAGTPGAAPWEIGFQATVQHRFNYGSADSHAFIVVPSVKHIAAPGLVVLLQAVVTERVYDTTSQGVSENDFTVQPGLVLSYRLPDKWFGSQPRAAAVFGSPELSFQASYANQSSNVANAVYQRWALGPVLTLSWKF